MRLDLKKVTLWPQAEHWDLCMENSLEGTEVPARVRARTSRQQHWSSPARKGPVRSGDLDARYCSFEVRGVWFSNSFWTRQLFMSAINRTFSLRQEIPWIQLNCPGPRPDSPSQPSISPSNVIL